MNGVHDMGGFQIFGAVCAEADEPVFHFPWEGRAFALSVAAPSSWSIDKWRHAVECLPPSRYLSVSYYEKWIDVLETALIEQGLVTQDEIEAGRQLTAPVAVGPVLTAEAVPELMSKGSPVERRPSGPARFSPGNTVRSRDLNPKGHTRLPRYVRGRRGTVERVHGCHVFPDSNAHDFGERPQWLYGVRFGARELWGAEAVGGDSVFVDLWEPYLELA